MRMTRECIKTIIDEEGLSGYNFFESRVNAENEIVIVNDSEQWIVYATDERASKMTGSEKIFDNEEEALENFVTFSLTILKHHVTMAHKRGY